MLHPPAVTPLVNPALPTDSDSHPLADQIAEVVVDRLLGFASEDTQLWERVLVALDPEAARLARAYERRARWLMEHAEDPVARYERLTGRRLDAPAGEGREVPYRPTLAPPGRRAHRASARPVPARSLARLPPPRRGHRPRATLGANVRMTGITDIGMNNESWGGGGERPAVLAVHLWRDDDGTARMTCPHAERHSPPGPDWGYRVSGPADWARSVLLALTDAATAEAHYQAFKDDVIAVLPTHGAVLTAYRRPRLAGGPDRSHDPVRRLRPKVTVYGTDRGSAPLHWLYQGRRRDLSSRIASPKRGAVGREVTVYGTRRRLERFRTV